MSISGNNENKTANHTTPIAVLNFNGKLIELAYAVVVEPTIRIRANTTAKEIWFLYPGNKQILFWF